MFRQKKNIYIYILNAYIKNFYFSHDPEQNPLDIFTRGRFAFNVFFHDVGYIHNSFESTFDILPPILLIYSAIRNKKKKRVGRKSSNNTREKKVI